MNDLIQAIEALKFEFICGEGNGEVDYNSGLNAAVDLINTHMAGKVIVPVEPTDEMLAEMWINESFSHKAMTTRYKAMLSTIGEQDEN